jgi:hypothetical protein
MKMEIRLLDLYERKPEFLPANLAAESIYVRPGELGLYVEPIQWAHVGQTFHPNRLQAADVQKKGYCLRSLRAGAIGNALLALGTIILPPCEPAKLRSIADQKRLRSLAEASRR